MCSFLKQPLWPKTLALCELNLGSCFTRITWTVSRKGIFSWRNGRGQVGARNDQDGAAQRADNPVQRPVISGYNTWNRQELLSATAFGLGQKEQSVFPYLQNYPLGRIIAITHHWTSLPLGVQAWTCSSLLLPTHLNVLCILSAPSFFKDLQLLLHSLEHVSEHF